jgi:hypothetical protein
MTTPKSIGGIFWRQPSASSTIAYVTRLAGWDGGFQLENRKSWPRIEGVVPHPLSPRTLEPSPRAQSHHLHHFATMYQVPGRCRRQLSNSLEVSLTAPATPRPSFKIPCPYRREHTYAPTGSLVSAIRHYHPSAFRTL